MSALSVIGTELSLSVPTTETITGSEAAQTGRKHQPIPRGPATDRAQPRVRKTLPRGHPGGLDPVGASAWQGAGS